MQQASIEPSHQPKFSLCIHGEIKKNTEVGASVHTVLSGVLNEPCSGDWTAARGTKVQIDPVRKIRTMAYTNNPVARVTNQ